MFPVSASNREAVDLELEIWDAIVCLENDTYLLLLPGLFTGWGNI